MGPAHSADEWGLAVHGVHAGRCSRRAPPLDVSAATEHEIRGVFEEFNALRAEILKRTELQHQMVSLALVAAGTCVTFGLQSDAPGTVALVYPFLAAFLAAGWLRHHYDIHRVGRYIRKRLETQPLGLQWETFKSAQRMPMPTGGALLSAAGVFISTQVLLLALGVARTWSSPSPADVAFWVLDSGLTITTAVLMLRGERAARIRGAEAPPSPWQTG